MRIIYHFVGRLFYWLFFLFFIFGIFLTSLNLASLVMPLRSPLVYNYYNDERKDVQFSYEQTMSQIDRLPGESDEEYVPRLATLISMSISPYWSGDEIDKFRVRVPIWENYILWLYSYINPKTYLRYEYFNYQKALERGVGLCSQYALVASQIMEENGVQTKMVGLSGHVLTMVSINDKWHIVDPEYDVVIPYSLEELETAPHIIEEYYKDTWAPSFVPDLFATSEDNKVIESAAAYKGIRAIQFEQWAYEVVWYLPLGFISPFIVVKISVFIFMRGKSSRAFQIPLKQTPALGKNQVDNQ
jgi:hypothetical protein